MEEDQYTKHLVKNQVCGIFHVRDTRKDVLPKFTKLCMETPFEGYKGTNMATGNQTFFN